MHAVVKWKGLFDSVSILTLFAYLTVHSNCIVKKSMKNIKLEAGDNIDRYRGVH